MREADLVVTQKELQAWLEAERQRWSSSMQHFHGQQVHALEAVTKRFDERIYDALQGGGIDVGAQDTVADQALQEARNLLVAFSSVSKDVEALDKKYQKLMEDVGSLHRGQETTKEELRNQQGSFIKVRAAQSQLGSDIEALRAQLQGGATSPKNGFLCPDWRGATKTELEAMRLDLVQNIDELRIQQSQTRSDVQLFKQDHEKAIQLMQTRHAQTESAQHQVLQDVGAIKGQLVASIRELRMECVNARSSQGAAPAQGELEVLRQQHNMEIQALRSQQSILKAVQGQHGRELELLRSEGSAGLHTLPAQVNSLEELVGCQGKALDDVQDQQVKDQQEFHTLQQVVSQYRQDLQALRERADEWASELSAARSQQTRILETVHVQHATLSRDIEALGMRQQQGLFGLSCSHQ